MTDYDTNLGVDRPNGNVVVSGFMHNAHMAGRQPGWLTKPQIQITGPNTFKPLAFPSAILMTNTPPDYIVAGDINPSDMELSIDRADNWANAEVYAWTQNDETENPNGVGVVHIGMWVHDDDYERVANDSELWGSQVPYGAYMARLYTISVHGEDGEITEDNINAKYADYVNGVPFIGDSHPFMSTMDTPVMQSPIINGYQMDSPKRCVFEYGGGKQSFRPNPNNGFNDFYNQWSYFTPGWYLAYAFLSFQPEQQSTKGYYAFSGLVEEWSDDQNSNLYFDMNIKSENAAYNTPDNPHAHHEKTRVFYFDGQPGWYNMHLRETTKGFMAPMLSTYRCPYVGGVPCAQIFRIVRL